MIHTGSETSYRFLDTHTYTAQAKIVVVESEDVTRANICEFDKLSIRLLSLIMLGCHW